MVGFMSPEKSCTVEHVAKVMDRTNYKMHTLNEVTG